MCGMENNLFSSDSVLLIKTERAARKKGKKFMCGLGIHWQISSNKQNKMLTLRISIYCLHFLCYIGSAFIQVGWFHRRLPWIYRVKAVNNPITGKNGSDPLFFTLKGKKSKKQRNKHTLSPHTHISLYLAFSIPRRKQSCDRRRKPCIKMKESVYQNKTETTTLIGYQAPT